MACERGHLNIVKVLNYEGETPVNPNSGLPLICAIQINRLDIVTELLDHNASPDIQDVFGQTPLHIAEIYGYLHFNMTTRTSFTSKTN